MRERITQAEAKRKAYAARNTSTYQGSVGSIIPFVEGWIVFIPSWKGKLHPDGNKHISDWNDPNRVEGRLIGMADPQGNYYLVPQPTASPSQPRLGNYYNLFDVEVGTHDDYRGLKQTVVIDPTDWPNNIEFVDATKP